MLERTNTEKALKEFGKYVVQQSRSNLSKQKKNVSKALYDSLKGNYKVSANSIETSFEMEDYGQFQDKGVRGKTSSVRAPNSPFKFGSGTGKKGGLGDAMKAMVKSKGFQFKNKKSGRFMSFDATAYLIARSIYNKGIKTSNFFTRPFELGFEKLPEEIVQAYGLDVESFLKYTLK